MKASNYKYLITIIFIFFGEQIAAENRIIINFESPPSLNQEAKLIQNIKNYNSVQSIESYLTQQNWIENFLIKSSFFGKFHQIFIQSKKPKYCLLYTSPSPRDS